MRRQVVSSKGKRGMHGSNENRGEERNGIAYSVPSKSTKWLSSRVPWDPLKAHGTIAKT